MKWRWAIPAALLVFLTSLVVHTRMASLYGWLAPPSAPITLADIGGTLGKGHIGQIRWHDHLLRKTLIEDLRWRLLPRQLLHGRLALHFMSKGKLPFTGMLGCGIDGLSLRGFRLGTELGSLLDLAGISTVPVDGKLYIDLHALHLNFAGKPDGAQGEIALRDISWDQGKGALPLGDLLATLSPGPDARTLVDIHSQSGPIAVKGKATLAIDALSLHDFNIDTSIPTLLRLAGFSFLPIDGKVQAELQSLTLSHGKPSDVKGSVMLHELVWGSAAGAMQLGDYRATLSADPQATLHAKLLSLSGPLDVNGKLSLAIDGSYQIDVGIHPKPKAPAPLVQILHGLGAPDASGTFHLRNKGRLAGAPIRL